ncbi:small integral membrane protein 26 [Bombina bombina]|uniref:small integral membrane protein 26 n=1 Tax=Bombina bombina TaxID=8345 RepID=UPI00235AF3A7|nr:small integral membrane protein 26 [Bombina bombina]
MNIKEYMRWNKRFSLVYAFGVWSMIGTYALYHYKKKREKAAKIQEKGVEEELQEDILPLESKAEERKPGFHAGHSIAYKDNFVPYSTRIYNFVNPLFRSSPDTTSTRTSEDK